MSQELSIMKLKSIWKVYVAYIFAPLATCPTYPRLEIIVDMDPEDCNIVNFNVKAKGQSRGFQIGPMSL
jgi:hypothetical protein